jgi:hypothetical protein
VPEEKKRNRTSRPQCLHAYIALITRLNRVTRIGVVNVGLSHFSTSKRKDFSAFIRFSFNVVPVGPVAPSCTRKYPVAVTRIFVIPRDEYRTQVDEATVAMLTVFPMSFQLSKTGTAIGMQCPLVFASRCFQLMGSMLGMSTALCSRAVASIGIDCGCLSYLGRAGWCLTATAVRHALNFHQTSRHSPVLVV